MSRGIRGQQIADGTIEGVDIKDGTLTFDDFDANEVNWKAPVANIASLPALNNVMGDTRVALAESSIHVWNGSSWETTPVGNYVPTSGGNMTGDLTIYSRRVPTVSSSNSFPVNNLGLGDECYRTDLDKWFKYNGLTWIQI